MIELGIDKFKLEVELKISLLNEIIFIKLGLDYIRIEKMSIKYVKVDGDYIWVFIKVIKYLVNYFFRYWL